MKFPGYNCTIDDIEICESTKSGLHAKRSFVCKSCNAKSTPTAVNPENLTEKAVLTCYVNGGGYESLKTFCETLSIDPMCKDTYNRYNHKIGQATIKLAQWSMTKARQEETDIAKLFQAFIDAGYKIMVILDGTWLKRGYKGNYSSLSGGACIIGEKTRKILDLEVKNKFCATCAKAEAAGIPKADVHHKYGCSKNFDGPASAMEGQAALEMFLRSVEHDFPLLYAWYIADGDSNVEALLNAITCYRTPPKKIRCKNHAVRCAGKMYQTAVESFKDRNVIEPALKKHLIGIIPKVKAAWHYKINEAASEQPRPADAVPKLKTALVNVVKHYCGDHSGCGNKCNKKEVESDVAVNPLVLSKLIAEVEKSLCNIADTLIEGKDNNIVEQFNSIVAKFVGGKRINYALGHSYTYRYHAACVHHNEKCFISTYFKEVLKEEPNALMKKSLQNRLRYNALKREKKSATLQKRALKKVRPVSGKGFYGQDCQKPDLNNDILIKMMAALQHQMIDEQRAAKEWERLTVNQSSCEDWLVLRRTRVTASEAGLICKTQKPETLANKVKNKFMGSTFQSKLMKLGLDMEVTGRQRVLKWIKSEYDSKDVTNVTIEECGLFIDPEHHMLACTPDGVIDEMNAIVEIKTACASFNETIEWGIENKKIKHLKYDKNKKDLILKPRHNYHFQVQMQLHITGRDMCIFITQTEKDFVIQEIYRDDKFWDEMVHRLIDFWYFFALEYLDSRRLRSLEVRPWNEFENFCKSSEWRTAGINNDNNVNENDQSDPVDDVPYDIFDEAYEHDYESIMDAAYDDQGGDTNEDDQQEIEYVIEEADLFECSDF